MKLSEVKVGKAMFLLFKGEPACRKSTAAASFPRPYFLDIDRKIEALKRPWSHKEDIEFDHFTKWYKIEKKLEDLSNSQYQTIVVDSLTSLGDVINLNSIQAKGNSGKKVGGIRVNSIEDYNAETAALLRVIDLGKEIVARGKHFILIAHVIDSSYREISGQTVVCRTLVTGGKKIAAKIPAYCPEIYHFQRVPQANVALSAGYEILTESIGEEYARTSLNLPARVPFTQDLWAEIQKAIPKEEVIAQPMSGGAQVL